MARWRGPRLVRPTSDSVPAPRLTIAVVVQRGADALVGARWQSRTTVRQRHVSCVLAPHAGCTTIRGVCCVLAEWACALPAGGGLWRDEALGHRSHCGQQEWVRRCAAPLAAGAGKRHTKFWRHTSWCIRQRVQGALRTERCGPSLGTCCVCARHVPVRGASAVRVGGIGAGGARRWPRVR